MAIYLEHIPSKVSGSAPVISADADRVQTNAYNDGVSVYKGAAAYRLSSSGEKVNYPPESWFQSSDGRYFLLDESWVSPFQLGAVGDGTTDDATALEAARDFCVKAGVQMKIDAYFACDNTSLDGPRMVLHDPLTIKGTGRDHCGIIFDNSNEVPGLWIQTPHVTIEDVELRANASTPLINGTGHNGTCVTLTYWFTSPSDPEPPVVHDVTFNRVLFGRAAASDSGHAVAVLGRSNNIHFNDCEWDGPGTHGSAILAHWGGWSDGVKTNDQIPPLVQAVVDPGRRTYHPNNVYLNHCRVRSCLNPIQCSSAYAIHVDGVDYINTGRGGQLINLVVGDDSDTFADEADRGKVYANFSFRNMLSSGHAAAGVSSNTLIDISGFALSKQTDEDLEGYVDSAYDDDPFGGRAQHRVRQPIWDNILFENIQFDCGPADPLPSVLPDRTIYLRNVTGNFHFKNIKPVPNTAGLLGLALGNCSGNYTFENCVFDGGVDIDECTGVRFINCQISQYPYPRYRVLLDYKLAFKSGTIAFTVSEVVTGAVSGATGTISAKTGTTTSGTLTLTSVTGVFQDNEDLKVSSTIKAKADIPNAFRFGDSVWAGTDARVEGYIVNVVSSASLDIQVTNGWWVFDAAEQLHNTRDEIQEIGAASPTLLSTSAVNIDGLRETVRLASDIAANAHHMQIAPELPYDAESAPFNVGATVTGGTSGASAEIVALQDDGLSGKLYLGPVTLGSDGTSFVDNETITDNGGSPGSARANLAGTSISFVKGLNFTSQTNNFSVGQTVNGQTSGAMGVVLAQRDGGTSGLIVLGSVTGTFQHGENIRVATTVHAVANGAAIDVVGYTYWDQPVSLAVGVAGAGSWTGTTCVIEAKTSSTDSGTVYVSGITPGPNSAFIDLEPLYATTSGFVRLNVVTGMGGGTRRVKVGDKFTYAGGVIYAGENMEVLQVDVDIEAAPAGALAGAPLVIDHNSSDIIFDGCKVSGGLRGYTINNARVTINGGSIRDAGQYDVFLESEAGAWVNNVELGNNGWRRLLPGQGGALTRDLVAGPGCTLFANGNAFVDPTYTTANFYVPSSSVGGAIRDNITSTTLEESIQVINPQASGALCAVENNRGADGTPAGLGSVPLGGIGTQASQPASGSVTISEMDIRYPYFSMKFDFNAARITVTDAGASGSSGSLKLFDFRAGGVQMLSSRHDWTAFAEGAALTGGAGDASFVIGFGSVAANAGDGALTGTEVNFGATRSITLSGGTGTGATTLTSVQTPLDGTSTPVDLYLNWSGTAATIDANSTIDVTGTYTINGVLVGDD